MLQVLLIGNGFDLAHGAPTSFMHFAEHIKKNVLFPRVKSESKDKLFKIFKRQLIVNQKAEFKYNKSNLRLTEFWDFEDDIKNSILESNWNILYPYLNNSLLKQLYHEQTNNWFDVESTYFNKLSSIKRSYSNKEDYGDNSYQKKTLETLNQEFDEIKSWLAIYLASINIKTKSNIGEFLKRIEKGKGLSANEILVIDFNYTETINKYDIFYDNNVTYVPIHGTFKSGNIIFGYGNDKDSDYKEIKNLGEDRFLVNFKTHQYLMDNKYQYLYNRLVSNSERFEIHILGHSLGLTDKTMLNELFETPNCKKIHLYKRRDIKDSNESDRYKYKRLRSEYIKLIMSATRIIEDQMARVKITSFPDAKYFP